MPRSAASHQAIFRDDLEEAPSLSEEVWLACLHYDLHMERSWSEGGAIRIFQVQRCITVGHRALPSQKDPSTSCPLANSSRKSMTCTAFSMDGSNPKSARKHVNE